MTRNPAIFLTLMSGIRPASVGSRAVPSKDPRLIFMVPLYIHLIMYTVARILNKGVRKSDNVFIYSEKGAMTTDFTGLNYGSSIVLSRAFAVMCLDFADFDFSVIPEKIVPLIEAIGDFIKCHTSVDELHGSRLSDFIMKVMFREITGVFGM